MSRLVFAGLDWAGTNHAVCVIDAAGAVLARFEVTHDRDGLARAARAAAPLRPRSCRIAIERPSGLIVDALVEAGYPVVPIHPNVVKATPAALPQPRRQERCLGRVPAGRPAAHRRPSLPAAGAAVRRDPRAACAGARARRPGGHRVRLANQLRACSSRSGPARPSLRRRRLADRAGLPRALPDARQPPLGSAEAHGRVPARSTPTAAGAAPPSCSRGCARAARGHAGELEARGQGRARAEPVPQLEPRRRADRGCSPPHRARRRLARRRRMIMMSFPRAGRICAAQILAELGDVRERFASDDHLAAEAGVAPVTYQSGKNRRRHLPLGLQPPLRARHHLPGRQLAPRQRVGRQHLPKPRALAVATIRTPSASSPAPGCA